MALTIVHTSDLHNRLDDARAEALSFMREEGGGLLLDSGDAIAAGNLYVRPSEPVLELMNAAGYDAMAVGNREYFPRKRGMVYKTRQARFPVLCANVLPREGGMGHIRRWAVLKRDDLAVGAFGLAPTMIEPGSFWERFSDLRFVDWRRAAREAVEALRGEVEWLVALSHRGAEDDLALAELCPEIDLILGGHSHSQGDHLVGSRPTLVSHAGHHGRTATVIRAQRDEVGHNRFAAQLMEMT
ncbi:MAG: metallophosphoesterase [Armatimonadota bacterium]|nr:metallophosphoesterase [Armatimonadota bacterium]